MSPPWLTIVGIGEDGLGGLSSQARAHIDEAEVLIGGKRHLAMIPDRKCERLTWPSPFSALTEQIAALKGRKVCVLATGDPMHYGVGVQLTAHFPSNEWVVYPAPSAFSLAAARMGWALQEVECLSFHGRSAELINSVLAPRRKIIALSSNRNTPNEVAALLDATGYGNSMMRVYEHMGGEEEKSYSTIACDGFPDCADLNTIVIYCRFDNECVPLPPLAGLPDDAFTHDGTMTKRDIRASALAKLIPLPGQLLWDVGAGAGSIAIEWMRAARGAQAIAIEKNEARLAMIATNADRLGTPDLQIVAGEMPEALTGLYPPDAVFIGGGLQADGVFEASWRALRPDGRLVAHAVSLESEAKLIELHRLHGGDLSRISICHAAPLGGGMGWKATRPVTQWTVTK